MAEFNQEELQKYYDARNYAGAADYLENHLPQDSKGILAVRSHIRQLRRDAAVQNSMLSIASPEQKQAFNFMQGIQGSGVIPRNRTYTVNGQQVTEQNDFGTNYNNYINGLVGNNGQRIGRIAIDIDNDDDFKYIQQTLGITNWNNNNLGFSYQNLGDGGHRIVVSTTNKNLYKAINASRLVTDKDALSIINGVAGRTVEGGVLGGVGGSAFAGVGAVPGALVGSAVGAATGTVEEIYDYFSRNSRVKIKGVDSAGNIYGDDDYNSDYLNEAINTVNSANEIYSKFMEANQQNESFNSEVVATQFLGAGDAEAFKAYQAGKIDDVTYNRIKKNWEDCYTRLVNNHDFNSTPVYMWRADSGEGQVLKAVAPEEIVNMEGELKLAMHDGRVSMGLAIKDGKIGTMFSITPKAQDGKNNDKWSKGKGEVAMNIFVEDLFEGSAEQMFEQDTKMMAARNNAEMKRYGYEQTLSSGNTVGYNSQYGAYVKTIDNNGNAVFTSINEDQMLNYLDEAAIIDKSLDAVLSNIGSDGKLYKFDRNGNLIEDDLDTKLMALATAGTNEIFASGGSPVEKVNYQTALYRRLKELLSGYVNLDNEE